MSKQRVKKQDWIADRLEQLEFVDWDRFVVAEMDGYQLVEVYGWIDRKDSHEDFVWSRFWPNNQAIEYTTSSDEYSEEIQIRWFGKENLDDHNHCRRVENLFDVSNCIELTQQQKLTPDGGQSDNSGK